MKVLIVNGSPHEEGSTAAALKIAQETLQKEGVETEWLWIGNRPISGCNGCGACKKLGKCVIEGDGVNDFALRAKEADAFLFGTPVHYAGMAGGITSFMDRTFYSTPKSNLAFKPAASVIVARRAGTTATYDQINKYFGICQMPIISSRYWNMVHGKSPEEVLKDEEGVQTVRILARNLAYFLKCLSAGKAAGVPLPEGEQVVYTNFIR